MRRSSDEVLDVLLGKGRSPGLGDDGSPGVEGVREDREQVGVGTRRADKLPLDIGGPLVEAERLNVMETSTGLEVVVVLLLSERRASHRIVDAYESTIAKTRWPVGFDVRDALESEDDELAQAVVDSLRAFVISTLRWSREPKALSSAVRCSPDPVAMVRMLAEMGRTLKQAAFRESYVSIEQACPCGCGGGGSTTVAGLDFLQAAICETLAILAK